MGMGGDMGMAGGMPGEAPVPAPTSDLDAEPAGDEFAATDAAAGGVEELGRERR
jgi:hypothetical protein